MPKKRSRSEDNILQANESYLEPPEGDSPVTPLEVGHEMSQTDPFYSPTKVNPFASSHRYKSGRKILGTSRDPESIYYLDLNMSPDSPSTPPSTPSADDIHSPHKRNCHSLPASPILLRKAAEKLHQESLHGRNPRPSVSFTGKPVYSPSILKSRSDIIGERLCQKLEFGNSLTEATVFSFPPEKQQEENLVEAEPKPSQSSAARRRAAFQKKQYTVDCAPMYNTEPCSYWDNNNADKEQVTVITEELSQISTVCTSESSMGNASHSSSIESFMSVDEPASSISSCSDVENIEIWYGAEKDLNGRMDEKN